MADAVLKHRGWAMSVEAFDRSCPNPITTNADGLVRFVQTGQGLNVQLSRYFRSRYEVVSRYTVVNPAADTKLVSKRTEEALLGAGRYLNGHRIKLQSYLGYRWYQGRMDPTAPRTAWTLMFQVEFGI